MEGYTLYLASRGHLGPALSSLLVDVVATVGLLVIASIALRLSRAQRRAAARADASFDPGAALVSGEAVVMGTVERAPEASVAVRVEIEQEGTESENSGVWSHKWTETRRKARVEPFYLRHSSGHRIRVEPGEGVTLVDEMDGVVRVDLTKRVRVAELVPGERVFAIGELRRAPDPEAPVQGGYRDRAEGYLLVPPRGGSMLLSSEPLGARFARRAAFHLRWAVTAVVAALAFHAVFAPFHARRWLGETVDARVAGLRHEVTQDDDGDDVHRFHVALMTADGVVFSDQVSHLLFGKLREGDVIQARYVRSWTSASAVGPDATAHSAAFVAVPLLAFIALAYRSRARSTRPWYEQRLVEEGSGKLEESEPRVQAAEAGAGERRRDPTG